MGISPRASNWLETALPVCLEQWFSIPVLALFDVTLEVWGLVRLYFPVFPVFYKCSTKSSFVCFGMQWTYIFKI